ncbi:hypothetical protein FQZ97_127610 [compost metagenome]
MDLRTLDTLVPAITARGAIVEKGRGRRKVIGDYLNNPQSFPHYKNTVGASLLAMGSQHSTLMLNVTPLSRAGSLPQGLQLDQDFLAAALALTLR